jgi:hypothetical protein
MVKTNNTNIVKKQIKEEKTLTFFRSDITFSFYVKNKGLYDKEIKINEYKVIWGNGYAHTYVDNKPNSIISLSEARKFIGNNTDKTITLQDDKGKNYSVNNPFYGVDCSIPMDIFLKGKSVQVKIVRELKSKGVGKIVNMEYTYSDNTTVNGYLSK